MARIKEPYIRVRGVPTDLSGPGVEHYYGAPNARVVTVLLNENSSALIFLVRMLSQSNC